MQDPGERLDRRRPGAGPGARRTRSRPPPRSAAAGQAPREQVLGRATAPARSSPQGAHTTTSGSPARTSSQVTRPTRSPARPERRDAARGADHLGHPVARRERRVGPLQQQRARRGARPHPRGARRPGGARRPRTSASRGVAAPVASPSGSTEASTPSSRCGSTVRTSAVAAEVREGLLDVGRVHRADRAEVLGHHEVGVEPGERALVEVVEVLAGGHARGHGGVDLGEVEALVQGARRDDAPRLRASGGWSHSKVTPTT